MKLLNPSPKVWEWVSNFIQHFHRYVSETIFVKVVPGQ